LPEGCDGFEMSKFIQFGDISADLGAPIIDGDGAREYYRLGHFRCAKEAAVALQGLKGKNRSAMPILFLYRQYLENVLKDALHTSNAFDLEQSDKKFGHDLEALWAEAKRVLGAYGVGKALDSLDETIAEFHTVDRRADAFRYAVDRNGQKPFKGHGTVVLYALIEQMDWAHAVLEKVISDFKVEERKLDQAIAEAVAKDPW
jgi:hypothetical protein